MPEQDEGDATVQEKPEDPPVNKEPIKIRCLLFFDGTLNSRENIDERLKHEKHIKDKNEPDSAIYLKNRVNKDKEAHLANGAADIDLEDDSYENDYSNIAHLEANVAPSQKGFDERVKVYVEGAGTIKYTPIVMKDKNGNVIRDEFGNVKEEIGDNKDQQSGFAFAAGESGIKPKVERGIKEAIEQIGHGPEIKGRDNTIFYVEKLTIDIFGFSRGAASARYCVYRLLQAMDVDMDAGTSNRIETYIEHSLRTMHMLEVKEVEVRFVGLFDTVVSYKAAQIMKLGGSLENWLVKQKAISHEKVKRVVHLASAEEHRNMFCLHNINSAGGKGEEYFLPGVHSDVGGGYLPDGSDAGLIVTQAHRYWAKKDRDEYLVAKGWFKDEELIEDTITMDDDRNPDYVQLVVTRDKKIARKVHNAYCKIPLKIMATKASESDITLLPALEMKATETINAFSELGKLESRIKGYMGKVGKRGSKPEDWQKAEPELNAIRHKHLHFSARYNGDYNGLGHNPYRSFFSNERKRYEFNG